jgi:hypothetical protein
MDCILEAKKFVQRAQEASHREVVNQHLVMADWYLNEALKEREEAQRTDANGAKPPKKPPLAATG